MIRINLLPFRAARKKEDVRRQLSIFVMSFILVVVVAGWYSYFLSTKIKDLNGRIKETRSQVEKYNKINKEIGEIKKKLNVLNQKIKVIQSLEETRAAPVELLRDMSERLVEKQMWITKLEERSGNIRITGIALDNPTVAAYMTRLESSPGYADVKLVSIQQDTSIKGLSLKRFNISFRQIVKK